MSSVVESLLSPPAPALLLGALGALVALKRRRLGVGLVAAAGALLYVFCCPWLAGMFLWSLQSERALPAESSGEALPQGPQAIAVLSAGWNPAGDEWGRPTVDALTLERVRYAAALARRTGLPLLTSGGVPRKGERPLAEMMREVLEGDFGLAVRWVEGTSGNTRENARESVRLLRASGIERVFLVTHAWHMPRARDAFRAQGFEVVAAPTAFRIRPKLELGAFWPTARALREFTWATHEVLGSVWYRIARDEREGAEPGTAGAVEPGARDSR